MYIVSPCFDWIGFHVTDQLLQKGYQVTGVDRVETDKQEHFALSIGRNSLFTHCEEMKTNAKGKDGSNVILIKRNNELKQVDDQNIAEYIYLTKDINEENNGVHIQIPLLYGEWMPRDEQGFYYVGNYITFDSKRFRQNAIYIKDFINTLLQIAESRNTPKQIHCKPLKKDLDTTDKDHDNYLFIRESEYPEKLLPQLHQHYQQFKQFY